MRMTTRQKRAIWYDDRKHRMNKYNEFITANNINLKELGLDKVNFDVIIYDYLFKENTIVRVFCKYSEIEDTIKIAYPDGFDIIAIRHVDLYECEEI